jgi:hypothetical protein
MDLLFNALVSTRNQAEWPEFIYREILAGISLFCSLRFSQ